MKLRMVLIDADDVTATDVAEVIGQAFRPLAAAIPVLPAATVRLPPSVPTNLAPSSPGWRPKGRPKNPVRETSMPRPVAAAKKMCDECGADKPEGLHGRANCPKCGKRAWVSVPAHRDMTESVGAVDTD